MKVGMPFSLFVSEQLDRKSILIYIYTSITWHELGHKHIFWTEGNFTKSELACIRSGPSVHSAALVLALQLHCLLRAAVRRGMWEWWGSGESLLGACSEAVESPVWPFPLASLSILAATPLFSHALHTSMFYLNTGSGFQGQVSTHSIPYKHITKYFFLFLR